MARVLLVEDSQTQAAQITMVLEAASHDVTHVENGKLGLRVLEDGMLDVVVTDLEMPEMNGLQLVQACLLYTSPSPRDQRGSRMPSSA